MLYNTHTRYGQAFGLGGLMVASELGAFTEVGFVGTAVLAGVAMLGSRFGAEFPDIDSKGSKPAQKHPVLRKAFKKFGVRHRGRFSHDVVVQTAFWGLILFLVSMLSKMLVGSEFVGSEIFGNEFFITAVKTYVIFTWVGVLSHLFADALTVNGVYIGLIFKVTLMPIWIKKIKIFRWKPFKKAFTAGSSWNDMHYKALTFILPILLVPTVITVFFL